MCIWVTEEHLTEWHQETESQTCCGLCSVLLENTQQLIQDQTRNDTTDPKSADTTSERYHSLDDVNQESWGPLGGKENKHLYYSPWIISVFVYILFRFIICWIKQTKSIPTWPSSFWSARPSRRTHFMSWRSISSVYFSVLPENTTEIILPVWPYAWVIILLTIIFLLPVRCSCQEAEAQWIKPCGWTVGFMPESGSHLLFAFGSSNLYDFSTFPLATCD